VRNAGTAPVDGHVDVVPARRPQPDHGSLAGKIEDVAIEPLYELLDASRSPRDPVGRGG
jgi:hypothetical protein